MYGGGARECRLVVMDTAPHIYDVIILSAETCQPEASNGLKKGFVFVLFLWILLTCCKSLEYSILALGEHLAAILPTHTPFNPTCPSQQVPVAIQTSS